MTIKQYNKGHYYYETIKDKNGFIIFINTYDN